MYKVLQYVGVMNTGGMEHLIMSFYRKADRTNIQFDFVVHSQEKGDYDDEIEKMGGKIYRFPSMRKNPFRYYRSWCKFWKEHKKDYQAFVVNTNCLANSIPIKCAVKADVINVVIHAHSNNTNKGKLQFIAVLLHKIHRVFLNKKIIKIACSDEAGNWMFGKKERAIIPSGVDYSFYEFNEVQRDVLRKKLGIHGKKCVLQVGHFLPVKNYDFSVEIALMVSKITDNVVFAFIGDGPEFARIQKKATDLGLVNIIFLGKKTDVERYMSAADMFIMPSLYEGLGMAAVEAQVSGLPIILSDNIPSITAISENVKYLSLDRKDLWVDHIVNYTEYIDRRNVTLDKSLDIQLLTQKYLGTILRNR